MRIFTTVDTAQGSFRLSRRALDVLNIKWKDASSAMVGGEGINSLPAFESPVPTTAGVEPLYVQHQALRERWKETCARSTVVVKILIIQHRCRPNDREGSAPQSSFNNNTF